MTGLTCDCGELVATCQLSEGYGVLTYIVCVAIAAVLWGALAQDECDEDDPPETGRGCHVALRTEQ